MDSTLLAELETKAKTFVVKRYPRCADSLTNFTPELTAAQITGKTTRYFGYVFQGEPIEVAIFKTTKETDMTEDHHQKYGPGRGVIENDVFYVLFMFGEGKKYAKELVAFQDSNPCNYYYYC